MLENKVKVKRIFIDMDGVLTDFALGVENMIGMKLTSDDAGHSEYDRRKEELTNKRLFRNLPPMKDMWELMGYLKHTGLPLEILTAAGVINRELVVWDKHEWIKQWVDPTIVVTCTMSGAQKAAFAQKGSVLIDDRGKNIDAWVKAGGIGIKHKTARDTIHELKKLRNGMSAV
tara:strand:+ start:908 stop:1426 length:519 start_codon:yes stop_codon:yes gene_type:complete